MVWDTCRADAGGLVPPHQEPASLLPTKTGLADDGAGVRGAVLGVPGGWRRPCGPCRPPWLWGLRWLAGTRRRSSSKKLRKRMSARNHWQPDAGRMRGVVDNPLVRGHILRVAFVVTARVEVPVVL